MTPDEHPRHHLADGPLSSLYAPSPNLSSFGAAFVRTCCSARPASSSALSVLPEDRIGLNIIYILLRPVRSSDSTEGALEEAGRVEQHFITEAAPNGLKLGEGA